MLGFESPLAGKKVFLTGHTGFTGTWLSLWLRQIGADVVGLSLDPITNPALSSAVDLQSQLNGHIGDIRDFELVRRLIADAAPDIVFHLAAQPLVRLSYAEPLDTLTVNVVGTANVLEAARLAPSVKAFVCVTTDKVYADDGSGTAHVEGGRLGGADPYSASKAAAELVTSCYQQTMASLGNKMAIASVRGGNIIGGGDWSEDRLIPDFMRSWRNSKALIIRSPGATRPWQHVLSACHGYMAVGAYLLNAGRENCGAWNIGPAPGEILTVRSVIEELSKHCQAPVVEFEESHLKETNFLSLDTTKARAEIGFVPPWTTREVLAKTAQWYRKFYEGNQSNAYQITMAQIGEYRSAILASA